MKPSSVASSVFAILLAASLPAQLPQGGAVQGGSVTFSSPTATSLQVTQGSERAAIDWQSFSIGAGHRVDVRQPGANSLLLNRVVGGAASEIFGQLNANGQVFLLNPNGIVFGRNAQANVGGLVASTLPLAGGQSDEGAFVFRGTSGSVQNAGAIKAASGDVYLIGLQVANAGTLEAPKGAVGLAAGTTVTLRPAASDSLAVRFTVANEGVADASVTNSGAIAAVQAELRAAGGSATALAVNNTGVIQATGLREEGGRIFLEAATGTAVNAGRLAAASAAGAGGTIQVLGDHVKLASGAQLDASGATGGGTILAGGDYQGGNGAIKNAQSTTVAAGATLKADATSAGDGGRVIIWADGATRYAGDLSARGGNTAGNGGQAEVSGKGFLDFQGTADLTAAHGSRGTLLLDPTNLTIGTVANVNGDGTTGDDLPFSMNSASDYGAVNSFITPAAITSLLGSSAVYLYASNDLTVNSAISYNSGQYLRLDAGRDIAVNAAIVNAGAGEINLVAGRNIALGANVSTLANIFLGTGGAATRTAGTLTAGFGVGFGGAGTVGTLAAPIQTAGSGVYFFSPGNVFINHTGAASVWGTLAGNFSLTASGAITESSTLAVTGTTTLAAGSANDITLAGGHNFGGAVSITSARNVALTDTNAIDLGASTISGTLTVNSAGTITDSGNLIVGGITTLASGATNDVTLNNANTFGGNVVVTNARNVTLNDTTLLHLGDSTISGSLSATGAGISGMGSVTVAGTTSLTAGANNILLNLLNDFTGAVSINSATNVTLNDINSITLGLSSPITGTLGVSAGGSITTSSAMNVTGGTTLLAGATGDITFLGYAGPTLTIPQARNVTLSGAGMYVFGNSTINGDLVMGDISSPGFTVADTGYLRVTGTTTIRAGSSGTIVLDNPGNSFGGTVTLASAGATTLVDGNSGIDLGAATITGALNVTAAGHITQSGFLNVSGVPTATVTVAGSDILLGGGANSGSYGGALVIGGTKTNVRDLTWYSNFSAGTMPNLTGMNLRNLSLDLVAAIDLPALTLTGNLDLRSYTSITDSGNLSIAGTTTLRGGIGGQAVTLNNSNNFGGTVSAHTGVGNLTLVDTGAIDLGTITAGGTLSVTAGGAITDSGTLTITGASTLAAGISNITLDSAANNFSTVTINGAGAVTVVDANALTFGGSSMGGDVNVTAGTSLTLNFTEGGAITARSLAGNLTLAGLLVAGSGSDGAITLRAGAGTAAGTTTGGDLINNAGASALNTAGTWRIYTGSTTGTTEGGLTGYAKRYNTGDAYVPGSIGNYIFYREAPTLTLAAAGAARAYGAANPALTGSATGFIDGDTLAGVGGLVFSSTANGATGVGTAAVTGAVQNNALNYTIAQAAGNASALTINPASLTYVADATARTYGAANPAFTGSVTGFVNGETTATATTGTLAFDSAATATSGVGSYAINGSGLSATNYTFTQAAGNATALTINPAVLTYTANAANRLYGASNPAFSGTVTGFVNGETTATATTGTLAFNSAATATSGVGSYAINGSGLSATNYTFTQAVGNATALTINPASLTYVAGATARTYGAANPAFTGSVTGFVNGENLAGATTGTLAFNSAATATSGVGSYAINGSGLSATNYTFTQAVGNATALTINPATLTYVADATSRTYGAANPAFTGSVTGFVNGETTATATTGTLAFDSAATATSGVGSYAINGSGLSATNYTFTQAAGNATALTINPAVLTYTANAANRLYGASNPAFSGSVMGFVNGETTATATTGTLAFDSAATATSGVGSYAINGSGLSATNYTFTQAAGNATALTINPAVLTYTANAANRLYGASNPAFSGTVTGFVNGETTATATTGTLAFDSAATATSGVGSYAINGSGLSATNYTFTQAVGNATALTINPATLTYVADATSRTYGAANPAFTGSVTGFVNGETTATATTGSLTFNSAATATSGVGSYAINGSGLSAANYTFTQAGGNATALTINPASLTYVADAASRTYGAANPTFTGSVTGFVNGETTATATTGSLTFGSAATATSGVGSYAINGSGLSAANYTFTQAAGNATALTINPASLTYVADAASRTYGAANPAFTGSVTGFVNGETTATATTGTLTFNSAATATSGVGSYAINGSGLSAANYTFTQAAANATALTINPATLTYVANTVARTYGAANPAFTGSVTGFVNGETTATATTGTLAFGSAATATSGVGSYAINGSGLSATNYTFTQAAGNATALTINPASLTYVADAASRTYGAANPTFTGSVTGFVNGETTATATTGTLTFNSAATATSGVGSYAINGSGLSAANYTFTQAAANATALTINPATLTYTASAASRSVGQANPAFTGTVTGFVNGEALNTATTGTLTFSSTANTASAAGNYAIDGSGLSAANYLFAQAAGNATALTILANNGVLVYTANPFARIYGTANPVFSGTVTGFLNGDTLASATTGTAVFTSSATPTSGVGIYAILGSGLSSSTYTFTQAPSNYTALTISPATLTYTANAANRTYGAANPAFTGTVTGFVNGETLASATTGALAFASPATTASSIGTYAINGSGLAAANYVFVQAAGNATALTINPAALTIAANSLEKFFGEDDPLFTYTLTGALFNGDQLSGALARTGGQSVGDHPIVRGTLTASPNYAVSFVPGVLTIRTTRNPAEGVLPGVVAPPSPPVNPPPAGHVLLSRAADRPFDAVRYRLIGNTPNAPAPGGTGPVLIHLRENLIRLPAELAADGDDESQD